MVTSPTPVGTSFSALNGVAAVSAGDIWAVGYSTNDTQTLVEQWNGTSWRVVPSPNGNSAFGSSNDLSAIAVVSTGDIWAVGFTTDAFGNLVTLIEQWNGTSWNVVPSVGGGSVSNRLLGVAAITATNVWAVGIPVLIEQYCC